MASFSEKLKDGMERARIVMLWAKRIEASGMSHAEFCRTYGIDGGQFSKWINGHHGPDWQSIERIETALMQAGV